MCPKLPIQLFLVSRAVYEDAFLVFYSLNRFVLRVHSVNEFRSLHLSQRALGSMTSLLIRLNSWPCPRGHEEAYMDDSQCLTCRTPTSKASPPLDITTRQGQDHKSSQESQASQDLLLAWGEFGNQLASSVSPGVLKLTFICDVTNKATAVAVLEPIERLPILKECTIRIGRHFDYELFEMARETALRTQESYIRTRGIFSFQRLPKELRLQILNFTSLGFYNSYTKANCSLHITGNKLVKQRCCLKCTDTFVDCCCVSIRAAYSSNCECRRIPFELSMVNKEMREDVIEVLLSQNCLQFNQDPEDTIRFFDYFPNGAPKFVRRIQLRFSENEIQEWNHNGYRQKLNNLMIFIKTHCSLTRLSVGVIVESYDLGCMVANDDETRFIYDVCCDITRALKILKELKDVQFELGWFLEMEPLMRKAILGPQHPKILNRPSSWPWIRSADGTMQLGFALPTWYKESDIMSDDD